MTDHHGPFSRQDTALAKETLRELCLFLDLNLSADVVAVHALAHMIVQIRNGKKPTAPPKAPPAPPLEMDWND